MDMTPTPRHYKLVGYVERCKVKSKGNICNSNHGSLFAFTPHP